MAGDASYAYGKLSIAIDTLAVGPGDIRERLNDAFLEFHPVSIHDLPDHLKADWSWIMGQLTKFGPVHNWKGEVSRGSVENTLSRIKNATGVKIAKRLVRLHEDLQTYLQSKGEL